MWGRRMNRLVVFAALLIALIWGFAKVATAGDFVTVALTDTPAPGDNIGGDFFFFRTPSINAQGKVAFFADTEADTPEMIVRSNGLWWGDANQLQPLAQRGDQLPGAPAGTTTTFLADQFLPPGLNDANQVVVSGGTLGGPNGLWKASPLGPIPIALSGDGAPSGISGDRFGQVPRTSRAFPLNESGDTIFSATFGQDPLSPSEFGYWIYDAQQDELHLLAQDDQVLDTGDLLTLDPRLASPNLLSNAGVTVFTSRLNGSFSTSAILSATKDSLEVLVAPNTPVPQVGGNATITPLSQPDGINESGDVVFRADVVDGDDRRGGVWIVGDEGVRPVILSGDPLVGDSSGQVFSGFSYEAVINDQGKVAVYGSLIDPDGQNRRSVLIAGQPGHFELVAAQGDAAPGTDSVFQGFFRNTPAMNAKGQLAFTTGIQNQTSTFGSLWATDLSGDLQLIIQEGDSLEVAPGDVREVLRVGFHRGANSGGADGRGSGINDLGLITFAATFIDGTHGIFISNLVAVPEPGIASLLLIAGWVSLARRRKHGFLVC